MKIVIYHRDDVAPIPGAEFLQSVLSIDPLAQMMRQGACADLSGEVAIEWALQGERYHGEGETIHVVPEDWVFAGEDRELAVLRYSDSLSLTDPCEGLSDLEPWNLILNGNYATRINMDALAQILACAGQEDVLAVVLKESLLGFRENAILTADGRIAGFRRYFEDSWGPAPAPQQWPQLLLLNARAMKAILAMENVPLSFTRLITEFAQRDLQVRTSAIGGHVYNLCVEDEFLAFYQCQNILSIAGEASVNCPRSSRGELGGTDAISVKQARLIGDVIIDKQATVDSSAVILGPSIIAQGASVEKNAIVDSSIIGPGVTVPAQQLVRNRILTNSVTKEEIEGRSAKTPHEDAACHRMPKSISNKPSCFRVWPVLSYARLVKRMGDIVAALAAIVLFLPLVPIIALVVKLSSPGPMFYKARRQGRHGKDFNCLKFRTMKVGADQIQEKLRTISEVDGPQFKIVDDPRITPVGRFLRDTYLDEIPQFYNVLLGQMSVVGPRPSPKAENIRCPLWRDARLSVRPGITGLWQINRTREPMQDFQEWIQYDTEYIRRLSFTLDIKICFRTFLQMLGKFTEKFFDAK